MYSSILTFLTVLGLSSSLSGVEEKVHIETFKGNEIAPYNKDLIKLFNTFFSQYPYLYEGSDADYTQHLESFAKSKNSIVAITFDGNKIVGAATGIPLTEAWTKYQEPLQEKGYDLSTVYYLGELALLPEYMGKGFGKQLVKEIEKFAKTQNYSILAATQIDDSKIQTRKPMGYTSHEDRILSSLGFQKHPEINFVSLWTNVKETTKSPHTMFYWIKSLK